MDKKAETHERILQAASRSLRLGGFRAVSVAETMKAAGLTHGGFYAHFPSHEALLIEALERAGNEGNRALAAALEGAEDGYRTLVEAYLSEAHAEAVEKGCAVAALASELPHQTGALRAAARERITALTSLVARFLPPGGDPLLVAATLVGTLQLARVLGAGPQASALLAASRSSLLVHRAPAGS